jgi:hypothetical protein
VTLTEPEAARRGAIRTLWKCRHKGVDSTLERRSRDAQRRPVHLDHAALERLTAWIDRYRLIAEERFRRLDALLDAQQHTQPNKQEEDT